MESAYRKLGLAVGINTVIMFFLTYTLIDKLSHFYPNINRFYMAIIMAAPMVLVMIVVMRSMYTDRRLNTVLAAGALLVFSGTLLIARSQVGVGDDQFLRSMIPHHSSAILMCENPNLTDEDVLRLCDEIIAAQKEEITQMETILDGS